MDETKYSSERGHFNRISPASLDVAPVPVATQESYSRPPWVWPSAAVLICLAVVVFILMPKQVLKSSAASATKSSAELSNAVPVVDRAEKSSPWQEAQWAKQRKLSQQVLRSLLEKQSKLEKIAVKRWAAEKFYQGQTLAEKGDELYRKKDYIGASEYYHQAAKKMDELLHYSETVFTSTMQSASEHLSNNNADAAIQDFELALSIHADDSQAAHGLSRAGKIDEILSLKAKGVRLEKNKSFDEALFTYNQALQLDPDTLIVIDSINLITKKIAARDFNIAMVKGYSELERQNFEKAKNQFNVAKKISLSSTNKQEALAALEEVKNRQVLYRIAYQRKVAEQYALREEWQKASSTYAAILTIDPNLDFAKYGLNVSQKRLSLERKLIATINQPQRLANNKIYQQAKQLYIKAASISDAGSSLTKQREILAVLLRQAVTPVKVMFQSDDATDVTIYQVAHIGNFVNHTLSLKPGKYIAVGSRDGYRDVRQEFQVVLKQPLSPIIIQCREKIL